MNPFTGKEYSDNYYKHQEIIENFPAANPDVLKKFDKLYKKYPVVIVKAATGAGKGAVIAPHIMMIENVCAGKLCGPRKVIVSEPRTANTLIAKYVGEIIEAQEFVGYSYRFNNKTSAKTLLTFATDGTLLNYFIRNDCLPDYRCVVIDEVHERNKNIDSIMTFMKRLLAKDPEKKLVILSATINPADYVAYYGKNSGVLEIEGRTHLIEHIFLEKSDEYIKQAVELIDKICKSSTKGDILIFLSSANELMDACRKIAKLNESGLRLACYELSRGTPEEIRETIIDENKFRNIALPSGSPPDRKIVFSTNIAESGITVRGVTIVIESGRRYEVKFSNEGIPVMEMEWISRAEADQRAGRAGRTQAGICYHLYSEKDFAEFPEQKSPEVSISDISDILFNLLEKYNLVEARKFLAEMPTPPTAEQLEYAETLLRDLHLLEGNVLTLLGREVRKIPLDPQMAISLLAAKKFGVERDACILFSMLSITDSLEKWFIFPTMQKGKIFSKWQNANGELYAMYKIMNEYLSKKDKRNWCFKNFLSFSKMENARRQFFKFTEKVKTLETSYISGGGITDNWTKIILALLRGYTRNIAIAKGPLYEIFRSREKLVKIDDAKFSNKISKYVFYFSIMRINGDLKFGGLANITAEHIEAIKHFNPEFFKKIEKNK